MNKKNDLLVMIMLNLLLFAYVMTTYNKTDNTAYLFLGGISVALLANSIINYVKERNNVYYQNNNTQIQTVKVNNTKVNTTKVKTKKSVTRKAKTGSWRKKKKFHTVPGMDLTKDYIDSIWDEVK